MPARLIIAACLASLFIAFVGAPVAVGLKQCAAGRVDMDLCK